jgi:protein tyrosine/serine phosphatase
MRGGRRGRWLAAWGAAALAASAFAVAAVAPNDNLREVDPGKFYRSGQMSPDRLREVIDTLGIKTIINLRGAKPKMGWYRDEVAVAREKGVRLISLRVGVYRLPHRRDLIVLLDAFRTAERPILVHCRGGADRSGLASAIYQMEYMGRQKQEALEMLSLRYLHIAWLQPAKRYFIERYQGEQWARVSYDPCRLDYEYYDKRIHCGG